MDSPFHEDQGSVGQAGCRFASESSETGPPTGRLYFIRALSSLKYFVFHRDAIGSRERGRSLCPANLPSSSSLLKNVGYASSVTAFLAPEHVEKRAPRPFSTG
jgi:hypothetical protein